MTPITEIPNGSRVYFDRGKFDDWCVYLQRSGGRPVAPRDEWYFSELQSIGDVYGREMIYAEFVRVYDATGREVDRSVTDEILVRTRAFGPDADELATLLSVIYGGMVAEERKAHTRLGKRVKRLGMHQSLMEQKSANYAANFSRGLRWPQIAAECDARGF